MADATAAAGDRRGELEYRTERDMLGDLIGEFREGWEIRSPEMWGEPWTAKPRRSGVPYVAGADLAELRDGLAAAAAAAGLTDMLAIEAGFPAWRVWRSSEGGWWATRQARLTGEMQECGLHATVGNVRAPGKLRALLAEQAKLGEWAAAHEWQVPGEQARKALGLDPEPSEFRNVGAAP